MLPGSSCKGAAVTPARAYQVSVCMPHGQAVAAMLCLPVNRKGAALHSAASTTTTDCGNHQGSHAQQVTQNDCQDQLFLHPTSFCVQHARHRGAAAAQRVQLPRVVDAAVLHKPIPGRHPTTHRLLEQTPTWQQTAANLMLHVHALSYPHRSINELLRPGSQHRGGLLC